MYSSAWSRGVRQRLPVAADSRSMKRAPTGSSCKGDAGLPAQIISPEVPERQTKHGGLHALISDDLQNCMCYLWSRRLDYDAARCSLHLWAWDDNEVDAKQCGRWRKPHFVASKTTLSRSNYLNVSKTFTGFRLLHNNIFAIVVASRSVYGA